MKRTLKTEAFVLRKRSLPNQDKIITLFTKESGKITTIAKGIKKITSRRLPHIQTANLINVILYKKNDRFYLQETALQSGFTTIKKHQRKLQLLYQLLFVVERMLPEYQPEPLVYTLVKKFLIELSDEVVDDTKLLTYYLNRLLFLLGYSKEDKSLDEARRTIQEIIHEKMPELHL